LFRDNIVLIIIIFYAKGSKIEYGYSELKTTNTKNIRNKLKCKNYH